MKIDILTLFQICLRLPGKYFRWAKENGILNITLTNIRDYSKDKHKKADDIRLEERKW